MTDLVVNGRTDWADEGPCYPFQIDIRKSQHAY